MPEYPLDKTIGVGDIQIGAVEIKDADLDVRQKVAASTAITEAHNAAAVKDATIGLTTDAGVVTNAVGTLSAKLRGLVTLIAARIPVIGQQIAAESMSVVPDSEDLAWAASGLATEAGNLATVAGDTTSIDGKTPALGLATPAASRPVVETGTHLGTNGQVIAIGGASVRSTLLAVGLWRISGSGDIWFRQGGNAVAAAKATAASTYLAAGAIETFPVSAAADGYIAIIQDGAETGNVSLTPIE